MTAVARLRLDTTPPALTWGPPSYAVAGESFSIPYLLDEGELTRAEVVFNGGDTFELEFDGSKVYGDLPQFAPEGAAMVRAYTVDDVGNQSVAERQILVSGFVALPPVTRVGGPPTFPPDRLRSTSRATVSSTSRVRVRIFERRRAVASSVSRVRPVTHRSRPVALVRIDWRVSGGASLQAAAQVASGETIARTMESQAHEEELVLIGLL